MDGAWSVVCVWFIQLVTNTQKNSHSELRISDLSLLFQAYFTPAPQVPRYIALSTL